jgi:hypothetical protein
MASSKSSSKSNTTTTGIDYSKWDRMQWSDDDDDDDDEREHNMGPRVTRLEAPSSISCTASGEIVIQQQQQNNNADIKDVPTTTSRTIAFAAAKSAAAAAVKHDTSSSNSTTSSGCRIPESWREKGSVCKIETKYGDAGNKTQLYWTQDRWTVTFRFSLLLNSSSDDSPSVTASKNNLLNGAAAQQQQLVRGWNCRVPGILSYDNRTSAVGTSSGDKPRLILTHKQQQGGRDHDDDDDDKNSTTTFFEGELPYPVHLPQDDDQVDWSIERIETTTSSSPENSSVSVPFLCVTLFKATPMAGMVLWWSRPFTSCPELAQMEWRHNTTADSNSKGAGGGSSNESFQQAWDEAHRLFQEKRLQEKQSTP